LETRLKWVAVGAGIGVVIMVVLITFHVGANPANIQIVDYRTSTPITQHYVISGRAVNSGGSASNPVIMQITVSDPSGNILYTTTTSPEPSILQPGQEAPFVKQFTSDDLGGYVGTWKYQLGIQSQ
jgi:hypothetical protein